jgi:hypothetical protein
MFCYINLPQRFYRCWDEAVKKMQVCKWCKRFCYGHANVENRCCGWPSTLTKHENKEQVHNAMQSDQWKRIWEISAEVWISIGSIHSIFHKDLIMHWSYQHLVPKMLTPGQKVPSQALCDSFRASAIFTGLVTAWDSPVFETKSIPIGKWFTSPEKVTEEAMAALTEVQKNSFQECF